MKQKSRFAFLYAFGFLVNLQFFGALAVPFYLDRLRFGYAEMFSLEALFALCVMAFEIPTGVIADRFGRKRSLFLGAIAFGAGFALFGVVRSLPALAVAEVVCALGMSLLSGADRALLYEAAKAAGRERDASRIAARYDAFGTAGMLVAFPAGSLFAGSGLVPYLAALGLVFVATGIACALASLAILPVGEPDRAPFRGSALKAGVDGFRLVFRNPSLGRFALNYAIVSSLTFFMYWLYQSLLLANRLPVGLMGFVPAAFNLAATLLLLATAPIDRAIGTKNALFLSSLVPGLLYLSVALVPGLPMALVAIFGVTTLKAFRSPLLATLMNRHIADDNRATVLSGISMIERTLTALLYPLAGLLTDRSLSWTFLAMGAITVLVATFLRIDERHLVTN